jgi:predicted ATPase/class 3 adenylate cyclase
MERRALPTGTVTFLFSDIEGSTRLVQDAGTATFTEALEQHHAIMRAAFQAQDGVERGTEGDSFLVVFSDAGAAVRAAVEAQRRLTEASWPGEIGIRVRMGLHTGLGVLGGDDYVGIDINKAARIASAAHGGQVLISDATRALIADRLPDGVRTEIVGTYRLKDIARPERLHQLEIRGLGSAFPPVRALDVRRAHLPPDATSFIGREHELERVGHLVAERRLVTLTGPGGTGKTRLALRVASAIADGFADGAFFVALAAVDDPGGIPVAIASTLGLPEDPRRPAHDIVVGWLQERELLLVLDNLEQIAGSGAVVSHLLASTPNVRLLATSRSPLRVTGEQEFMVQAFGAPAGDATALETSDAVRLFVDRARLVRPDFSPDAADLERIAEICAHVDGLPLAIELAAARLRLLPLAAIRDRVGRPLDALVGGPADAPSRQRSLREAIAWSHDLVDQGAQALFRRLAVFAGGWTPEAAGAIAGGPPVADVETALGSLVEQSLVQRASETVDRLAMLPTIADFAREKLDASAEGSRLTAAHAAYFRRLAETVDREAQGGAARRWFDLLEADLDNVRAAIDRAVNGGDPSTALAIAAALRPFWLQRNRGGEGLRTLTALVDRAVPSGSPEFAAATAAAAAMATWLGDYATGRRMGELSVAAHRLLDDASGLGDALGSLAFATIEVDPSVALELNRESLDAYVSVGDVGGQGQALLGRATAQFAIGHLADVRTSLEQSVNLCREAGDHYFAMFASLFLGRIKILMDDTPGGVAEYRSVLAASHRLDLRLGIAVALDYLAEVAVWADDVGTGVRLAARAARIKEELGGGIPPRMGGALDPLDVGRRTMSAEAFEACTNAGRAMDLESAVAEAFGIAPPAQVRAAPHGDGAETPPP